MQAVRAGRLVTRIASLEGQPEEELNPMINSTNANNRRRREGAVTGNFLESPNDESFTELFLTFTPQLVSFFRSHGCGLDLSEDLSQEVMLAVYRKSTQIRDRTRFRAWLFTIGRHALYRHYGKQSPKVDTVDLESVIDTNTQPAGRPAFEFHHWMSFLESREREALTMRLRRGMGIPRNRRRKSYPDRDGPVASIQRQEKASHTSEGARALQKEGSLNPGRKLLCAKATMLKRRLARLPHPARLQFSQGERYL
jgi:hypothetical protein